MKHIERLNTWINWADHMALLGPGHAAFSDPQFTENLSNLAEFLRVTKDKEMALDEDQ